MDLEFLQELDSHISNIGADEYWKKQIGKYEIWFAPLTATAQAKVNEALMSEDMGMNSLAEAKRITMANAIVGIDQFDLREYRDAGAVFKIPGKRKNESVRVDLPKYILTKIQQWGNDWIDLAFDVFADLMESFNKKNREGIKFENLKDPKEELMELEMQAAAIRKQLGMPQMVEGEDQPREGDVEEAVEEATEALGHEPEGLDGFDPFKKVEDTEEGQEEVPPEPPEAPPLPPEPPMVQRAMPEAPPNPPEAVTSIPTPDPAKMSPIEEAMVQKAQAAAQAANVRRTIDTRSKLIPAKESSVHNPMVPTPSIPQDGVIEKQAEKPEGGVKIDKKLTHQSKNPRFRKPMR
jgi:hypothetical protein